MQTLSVELPDLHRIADLVERWQTAHPEFAALLGHHGEALPALRQFGTLTRRRQEHDIAAEALLAALALAPTDTILWRELASLYQVAASDELAAACAARALDIDPHHAVTWLQFASLVYKLQDIDKAEHAYLRALALDPDLGDADLGLGVLYLGIRKFDEAIVHLRAALLWGGADAATHLCLGQALYMAGRFGECADSFEAAATFTPLGGIVRRLYARARTFAAMLDGDIEGALARYPALAQQECETTDTILQAAFLLFSAYGMRDAAIAVGRRRLAISPDDHVQRYLLDAVTGSPHDRAPAAYVEAHFDEFAHGFDSKLVDVLGYRVPQDMADLVASCRPSLSRICDLGCGTGLAAQPLQRFGGRLTGVDLSEKMLAVAGARHAYGDLIKADVVDFLASGTPQFDLIFAADLLIYLGKLDVFFASTARALAEDGLFAASIETTEHEDFVLLPSGRFAHSASYFEAMASTHFDIVRKQPSDLRIEAGHPVSGLLYVMRRRGA